MRNNEWSGENSLSTRSKLLRSLLMCSAALFVTSSVAYAETAAPSEKSNADSSADSSQVKPNEETQADDDELIEAVAPKAEDETITLDPMEMLFKVSKIERGLGRDSRVFSAPRIVTLTTLGAVGELSEKVWSGKTLGVFHKVPIDVGNGLVSYNRVKVGEIKVKAVSQSILLAEVTSDDLTRSFDRRQPRLKTGEARVVMLGDTARLERPIVEPPKVKRRRVIKPVKKTEYERKDMKWRL